MNHWVIREDELLAALRRAADSQQPDLVMAELLANSEPEPADGDPGSWE